MDSSPQVQAVRQFAEQAPSLLSRSQAFKGLNGETQKAILGDLKKLHHALGTWDKQLAADPYSFSLDTPDDFLRHRRFPGQTADGSSSSDDAVASSGQPAPGNANAGPAGPGGNPPNPTMAATQTLASRTGALSDEINFPSFVAALVHGTFDAIVDATIRQMEAFADLVSAVGKDVDQFTNENVTTNQAKDWLVKQHPQELQVSFDGNTPSLQARPDADGNPPSPDWLADYGLQGQSLDSDTIEQQLIPQARKRIGQNRLQTLATMVLLGMNRVVVRDGSISAHVLIRAQAEDKAKVDYAISTDPSGGQTWGDRASSVYSQPSMMVSTIGVNVQTDTQLKAELFGEVRINFASETLPLERFVDPARITLLQRNSRVPGAAAAGTAPPVAPAIAAPLPLPAATPASPAPTPAAVLSPVAVQPAVPSARGSK